MTGAFEDSPPEPALVGRATSAPGQEPPPDLRHYLRVLRRSWWLILLTLLATTGTALGASYSQPPEYEASTQFLINPPGAVTSGSLLHRLLTDERDLATHARLVTTTPVAEEAAARLDSPPPVEELLERVTAVRVADTSLIEVRARAQAPGRAAAVARAFAEAYLDARRETSTDRLLETTSDLRRRSDAIRDRLEEIARQKAAASPEERAALEEEGTRLLSRLGQLNAELATLTGSGGALSGGGRIVEPARASEDPVSPQPVRNGLLAAVLGAFLGAGLAFGRDELDQALRSPEEVEKATGREVLAQIPAWRSTRWRPRPLVARQAPVSAPAEAFRTLRANLQGRTPPGASRSLVVTSATGGEGKTSVAANLACTLAQYQQRIVLVSADHRRARVHRLVGAPAGPGLTEVMAGRAGLEEALADVGVPGLRLLPAGDPTDQPAAALASPAMGDLTGALEQVADVVVYDTPPVLAAADVLELITHVPDVLFVVASGSSRRREVTNALRRLESAGGHVVGLTLNRVRPRDGTYHYYQSYAPPDARDNGHPRRASSRAGGRRRRRSRRTWSARST